MAKSQMNEIVSLDNLDKAKALVEVANTSQLKEIIGRTEALRVYARQAKLGLEIQNQCAEIKLRAERRLGKLLKEEIKHGGDRKSKSHYTTLIALKDLGLDKHQSSRMQAVASLPDRDFERHVAEVKKSNEELTTMGVIRLARELGKNTNRTTKPIPLPKGKFNVIYLDLPWEYDRTVGQGVAIEQYELMPLEEIKAMKVSDLAAPDCLLFLWATFPKLAEALEVIKAWGFDYKTVGFTWIKTNKNNDKPFFGIGSYTKSNAEVCLLATRGEPHRLVRDNSVSSVIHSPRREHSRKPDEAREGIDKLVGDIPKIELFARQTTPGWDAWGNEVTKFNDHD